MDELEARIEALERAVTDGDHDLSELATAGETGERLATVETELEALADRVAELEAATQALRGYVGNVRAVNRDVERRADAALARAESIERALVGDGTGTGSAAGDTGDTRDESGERHHPDESVTSPRTTEQGTPRGTNGQDTLQGSAGADSSDRATPPAGEAGHHGGRAGEAGHHGDHTQTTEASPPDRCRACGQRTAGRPPEHTPTSESGSGSRMMEAAQRAPGDTDDPLGPVFDTDDSHENGDGGTFDRIRQML